jgi:MYXO-CTERM domain-containing protein
MATLVFAVFVTEAKADIEASDGFNYDDGNLVLNEPPSGGIWNAHSGAGAMPVQVVDEEIVLNQGSGSREDVNIPFENGAIGAGDVLYSGFDLTVPDPGASITSTYFAMFLEGTSFFNARVWITAPTSSGYRLAISNDNSITDVDGEVFSVDLDFDTTYRIVTKYDYDNAQGTLWIDPEEESDTSIVAGDPGFSDEVASYAFRQAAGNTTQIIDCLTVATSFDEALTCVPEPASALLALLALVGVAGIRRRM